MKATHFVLFSALLAVSASAQDSSVVPDTLDWQRYLPLEVGNRWEYGGLDAHVRTIVGDTMANGHHYFIRRDSIPPVGNAGPFLNTFYLRYDEAGTVRTVRDPAEDTTDVPLPPDDWSSGDFLAHFDMRMAFGDTLDLGDETTLR